MIHYLKKIFEQKNTQIESTDYTILYWKKNKRKEEERYCNAQVKR